MKKRVETKKRILEVLKHLEQIKGKEWWDLLVIILWVYRPEQIDKDHERNRGLIGFKVNWNHTLAEKFATFRAVLNLEKMGLIEGRIIRVRDSKELTERRVKLGSHVSSWKEIRLVKH